MTLSDWLEREGLTLRAAEKRFGGRMTFSAIGALANGTRNPQWDSLLLILKVTKGAVTPNDFVPKGKWPREARA